MSAAGGASVARPDERGPEIDLGGPGVVARVLEHAGRAPSSIAVVDDHHRVDYAELDRRSGALAAELTRRGVGRGDVVAVVLPRGHLLVGTLLGILRAGAAYCAIDVRWPPGRVREVVEQVRAAVVVGPEAVPGVPWLDPRAELPPASPDPVPVLPDDGCCVYFTSGSTGVPKAALSPHRAVLRTVLDPRGHFPPPPVRMLSVASVSWDAYTFEVWFALVHGGTTYQVEQDLVTPETVRNGIRRGVTSALFTTSMFNLVVEEDVEAFAGIQRVMAGGERQSPRHLRTFLTRFPAVPFVNVFGPVEASLGISTHLVRPEDCDSPDGIPVGTPLANTTAFVVAPTDRPDAVVRVPDGRTGELLVAGDCLATGYLGDPENEAFADVSVDGGPPCRVYRTGDRVRRRADGLLEYVGRVDRQLKIRGQRVEPAELERALDATGEVLRRVVVAMTDGGRPTGLAAYVVPVEGRLDVDRLLAQLRRRLPEVLVPRAVVVMDRLPTGTTGKIDESALPPLPSPVLEDAPDGGADEDEVTAAVRRRAADVLGVGSVPADGDLRAAGLDSLGAIRLTHRLLVLDGVTVAPETVLRAATPRRIAAGAATAPATVPATVADSGEPTPGQTAMWLDDLVRPERAVSNVVLLGYQFDPGIGVAATDAALRSVCARHDALRTAIRTDDDGLPESVTLDVADALAVSSATWDGDPDTGAVGALAAQVSLGDGPLVVARLETAGGAVRRLLLAIHHACFDGHSEALLVAELSTCLRAGELPPVRPFALAADPRCGVDEGRVRAWTQRLAATQDVTWPRRGGPQGAALVATVPMELSPAAAEAARTRATEGGVTVFTEFLRAAGRAVREVTGARSFCLGVPAAGRDDPAAFSTIGYFVQQVVVPMTDAELDGPLPVLAATWDEALHCSRVGVHELARRSGRVGRDRSSLFQVQLAWQNTLPATWELPGVRVTPVRLHPAAAQFDMTLEFWPREGGSIDGSSEYDPSAVAEEDARAIVRQLYRELGVNADAGTSR